MSSSLRAHPRSRWWALIVISLTQLVVVLDCTIVNIALPRAQAALGLSDGQRQWVVTAYALAFGALLLLGGRIADYVGRKRVFMIGMVGFGAASLYGGFAQQGWELILARGLQGAFAALLAPAALALLTVTFPSGRERNTAFAVFGTVAGTGAAVGLLLPLRVVADRVRGAAFLIQGIAGAIMIGATIYLTFHLQFVLGMGVLQAGLASLPLPIATMVLAPIATKLLSVIGPRPQLVVGPLFAAVGLFLLSGITPDGAYFVQIAPGLVLLGIGMGFVFIPLQNLALSGVAPHDAGVASAVANSSMQIGGSIGLSVFTAVYAASVGGRSQADLAPQQLTDAYGWTFITASILMVVASVIAATMVRGTKEQLLPAQDTPVLTAH